MKDIDIDINNQWCSSSRSYFENFIREELDTDVELSSHGDDIVIEIKFLTDELQWLILELDSFDDLVEKDSLMALAYMKILSMMNCIDASFDFGADNSTHPDFSYMEEVLMDQLDGDAVEDMEKMYHEILKQTRRDFYGYPYHYGKLVEQLMFYEFDFEKFFALFDEYEWEYKDIFRLTLELSRCENPMLIATRIAKDESAIVDINIDMGPWVYVCYKEYWTEYHTLTSLGNKLEYTQSSFENCEFNGIHFAFTIHPAHPFPMDVLTKISNELKNSDYAKTLFRLQDQWCASFHRYQTKETKPLTNDVIENYCKKNNCSVFSWLKPGNYDGRTGDLSKWNSFRDFNTQWNYHERDWPFTE